MIDFDHKYNTYAEPFSLEGAKYERDKRSALLSLIEKHSFDLAIDYGCGLGDLAIALSERARRTIAIDSSRVALRRLQTRLQTRRRHKHLGDGESARGEELIALRLATPERPWPVKNSERAELIVASEVLYYLNKSELHQLYQSIDRTLSLNGIFITCHYRLPFHDRLIKNEEIHDLLVCSIDMKISTIKIADRYDLIAWKRDD